MQVDVKLMCHHQRTSATTSFDSAASRSDIFHYDFSMILLLICFLFDDQKHTFFFFF